MALVDPSSSSAATEQTFLFADIAGYSALTEAHGDETAADLASAFCRAVADGASASGELVKTIGDAVMLRFGDAAEAIRLGLRIPHEIWTGAGRPAASVGLHTGAAVERDGDWFGSAVNVAARLAALAAGGEVLVSAAARHAAGDVAGIHFHDQGEKRLRNLSAPVVVYLAHLADHPSLPDQVDPVCRMMVAPGAEAGVASHEGVEYRFCSQRCAERFDADPEGHLRHLR